MGKNELKNLVYTIKKNLSLYHLQYLKLIIEINIKTKIANFLE